MPNPSGSNDYGRVLSDSLDSPIPSLSAPFGLNICGFMIWIIGGVALLGVAIAAGFAIFNNPGETGGFFLRDGDIPQADFNSPGLGDFEFEIDLSDLRRE